MPVPAPEDRILNPGVRENLLQPDLRVGHPVQLDVTLQVRILFCRSARAACDACSETQDRQLFDPARYARTGWCRSYTSSCSARTPARAGLLQADADRRGPALFLAGDWVPRDVVAMPRYTRQESLSLQELRGLTAGLTRVSIFLAERGYRWQGRPDTRSPLMICLRIRAASRTYDRGSASPRSTGRFMGIPPCRRPITLVHGRLVS